MNLEDVINLEYGLQQDEWSLTRPKFGKEGQLEVIGWSGKNRGGRKVYILQCNVCSQDSELFGEGYFSSRKDHLISAVALPCGCSKTPKWSEEQFAVRCSRKAMEMGYKFLGFDGNWVGSHTKTKLMCGEHGEWSNSAHNFVNKGQGCMACCIDSARVANMKPDSSMVYSFFKSGSFHPDTKFWRSEKLNNAGKAVYWYVSCPICGKTSESFRGNLQQGHQSCACSPQKQQECYVNWVVDENNSAIAIKFGIACNSKQRIKSQNRNSIYEVRQHLVYTFPDVASCKKAEKECKKELECGIVSKTDMKDGWTETTSVLNLGRVKNIYERNGGVLYGE